MFAATVGMGHGRFGPDAVLGGGTGRCVWASAGEGPGVVDEPVGEEDASVGAVAVVVVVVDAGAAEVIGVGGTGELPTTPASIVPPSFSRRRLTPREVLSFRPSEVALIRI